MGVLPRVVVVPLVVMAAATGCSKFNAALGQQQVLVSFKSGTTNAAKLHIRAACGSLPAVRPSPLPDLKKYPYALNQLSYRVDSASDADIARLEQCLAKFGSVAGVTMQDSSDTGA
jgi:hypothetical protein